MGKTNNNNTSRVFRFVTGICLVGCLWSFSIDFHLSGLTSDSGCAIAGTAAVGGQSTDAEIEESDALRGNLIAYVSQGPASSYPVIKKRLDRALESRNDTYRLFFHSFDRACEGCIFQKQTSFAQGKNLLVKAVAESPDYARIKYVALFDDDGFLFHRTKRAEPSWILDDLKPRPGLMRKHIMSGRDQANADLGWATFHDYLLSNGTTHPLLKPQHYSMDFDKTDTFQSCTDEAFWVVRTDFLHLFYPFQRIHEHLFWLNAAVTHLILERCYPGGMLVLHDWAVANIQHRYHYENSTYYNTTYKLKALEDYLEKRLHQLKPWRLPTENSFGFLNQRCTVKMAPSQGVHPECAKWTKQMFRDWLDGTFIP